MLLSRSARMLGCVPCGSDDRNVVSLTFIKHTRLNTLACLCACVFVLLSHSTCYYKSYSRRHTAVVMAGCCTVRAERETQSQVSRARRFPVLEVHFNAVIMIDRWYDYMTHCWSAAHLLLVSIMWPRCWWEKMSPASFLCLFIFLHVWFISRM